MFHILPFTRYLMNQFQKNSRNLMNIFYFHRTPTNNRRVVFLSWNNEIKCRWQYLIIVLTHIFLELEAEITRRFVQYHKLLNEHKDIRILLLKLCINVVLRWTWNSTYILLFNIKFIYRVTFTTWTHSPRIFNSSKLLHVFLNYFNDLESWLGCLKTQTADISIYLKEIHENVSPSNYCKYSIAFSQSLNLRTLLRN